MPGELASFQDQLKSFPESTRDFLKENADTTQITSSPSPGGNKKDTLIICKMEPFNVCYKFDEEGNMQPIGDTRPVRIIRVY